MKNKIEMSLSEDNHKLHDKLNQFNVKLKENTSELERLCQENKLLQDRATADVSTIKLLDEDLVLHKKKCAGLNQELEAKTAELVRIEKLIAAKEKEFGATATKLLTSEETVKQKLEECVRHQQELSELQGKYAALSTDSTAKISSLTREIDRLNKEKDSLAQSFEQQLLAAKQPTEVEVKQEKIALKNLESQALNAKYESKIQYLEIEIDTLRSKIRKLLKVGAYFGSDTLKL